MLKEAVGGLVWTWTIFNALQGMSSMGVEELYTIGWVSSGYSGVLVLLYVFGYFGYLGPLGFLICLVYLGQLDMFGIIRTKGRPFA